MTKEPVYTRLEFVERKPWDEMIGLLDVHLPAEIIQAHSGYWAPLVARRFRRIADDDRTALDLAFLEPRFGCTPCDRAQTYNRRMVDAVWADREANAKRKSCWSRYDPTAKTYICDFDTLCTYA